MIRTVASALAVAAGLLAAASSTSARVFPVNDSPAHRAQLEKSTAYILSLSREEIIERVPVNSGGIYFTSCPNCDYGAEEAGCFKDTWDPRHPTRLVCKGCGETYPNNPKYPDDQFIEIDAPDGKTHRFYYYEREDGYRFWFRQHAGYWAREWLQAQARDLGELYAITGEARYAEAAATILTRFAEVYPGYASRFDYPFKQKQFVPYTQHRVPGLTYGDYRTARWTWWAYMDIPVPIIEAYDHIHDWPGLDGLYAGDARRMIEEDFIGHLVEFVLAYPDDASNMSMGLWRAAIYAGRVLQRPEWVHESVGRFEHMLATRFLYDGHWLETSGSYAQQTRGGMIVVMEAAKGYSDPSGYTHPETGRRFDDLDLREVATDFEASEIALAATRLPDNRLLPLNDTWAVHGKSSWWLGGEAAPRESMEPFLLPGAGVAVLGGGEGADQLHAHLNFTMGRHHKHSDALAIGLFAFGREMLPDIGYTWTNYRLYWPTSTMAHSTVVVDGVRSGLDPLHTGHQLRQFAIAPGSTPGSTPGFQLASVDSLTAYPQLSRYRRTLAFVGQDARDGYLIDIFEVRGGKQHDYLLLGSVDHDTRVTLTGAALKPTTQTLLNPDVTFARPTDYNAPNPPGFGFGFWTDLRTGPVTGPLTLDVRYDDRPDTGVRTTFAAVSGTSGAVATLARVPSIRRAEETNAHLDRDTAPAFDLRRKGENLASLFVAVHEPVQGEPRITAVVAQQDGGQVRVQVRHADGRRDVLDFSDDGRYALRRFDAGNKVVAHHALAPAWSGSIAGFGADRADGSRGWFEVEGRIDASPADLGVLKITFPDQTERCFTVVSVEPKGPATRLRVRETPGFTVGDGQIQIVSYPQRTIPGHALRYSLARWTQPQ